jgi:hypothetical protein
VLVALGPQAGSDLWDKAVTAAQQTPDLRAIVALGETNPGSGYVHLASQLPSEDGPLDNPPAPAACRPCSKLLCVPKPKCELISDEVRQGCCVNL